MGEQIIRMWFSRQRDFARFVLRGKWIEVHRVQLKSANRKTDGNEVFYFENSSDAMHFRLAWTGFIPNQPKEY